MQKNYICRTGTHIFFPACIILILIQIFSGCASSVEPVQQEEEIIKIAVVEEPKPPSLVIQSPQEAVYNGAPRSISYSYSGEDIPRITYYPSLLDMEEGRGGSSLAPIRTGNYYVIVKSVYEEVQMEFNILKCPVKIEAEKVQEAIFNGNTRRVQAKAEPPVSLSYFYYPSREFMEEAKKAAEESADKGNSSAQMSGYRRVDRSPSERGTYYVWIYFPGDENHLSASAYVEFTIRSR